MSVFDVSGINVGFKDFNPSILQRNILTNTIRALNEHKNAMIESPDGTDRLLLVLGAVISFQKSSKSIQIEPPTVLDPSLGTEASFSTIELTAKPGEYPQIICVCRDEDSLSSAVHELKKISEKTTICVLNDFQKYCLNEHVKKSEFPDFWCNTLQCSGDCSFAVPKGNFDWKQNFDIEEIRDFCIETRECPFFREKERVQISDVIFVTADVYFSFDETNSFKIIKNKAIFVFEDLPDIENMLIAKSTFSLQHREIQDLIPNRMEVGFLREFLGRFDSYIVDKCAEVLASGDPSECVPMETVWEVIDCQAMEWGRINSAIEILRNFSMSEEIVTRETQKKIEHIFTLLKISYQNHEHFCVEFIPGNAEHDDELVFHCLHAAPVFNYFTSDSHAIILTADVLTPMQELGESLGCNFPVRLSSAKAASEDEKFAAFTLSNTNDGTIFQNTFKSITEKGDQMFLSLGKMMENMLQAIPDGIILFTMDPNSIVNYWKKNDFTKRLKKIKPLFYPLQGENYIDGYKSSCMVDRGGLLITDNFESIKDMKGKQIRAIFVFGIPRDDSAFADLVRSHKREAAGVTTAQQTLDWSEINGLRTAYQCADLVIEGPNDYGMIAFVDNRYQTYIDKSPKWLKQHTQTANSPTHLLRLVKTFFSKATPEPPEFQLSTDKQVLFTCAKCEEPVLAVRRLKTIDTVGITKHGFLEIVAAEGDEIECLPVSGDINRTVLADSKSITWSAEDDTGYTPIVCSCGMPVGAEITVFTEENKEHADEIWLIKERVTPMNPLQRKFTKPSRTQREAPSSPKIKEDSQKTKSSSQKSQRRSTRRSKELLPGQTTLSFF